VAHKFKDFEHLLRLAGLFVAGIVAFVLVRAILVPSDFGVYGHFRAGALADNSQRPLRGGHEEVRCEACHGPLAAHADDPSAQAPELPNPATVCLKCHLPAMAKAGWYPQVDPAEHADNEPCDTCHIAHAPRIEEG
jgi:hypothetical protein